MKSAIPILSIAILLLTAGILAAQTAVPSIAYDSSPNFLKLPDGLYLGEAVGVATNSKGHVFVYTRSGSPQVSIGTNRTFARNAARLFEFDQNGKYLREIGQGLYGFVFAHAVRVDRQDNIWVIDEGSNMVIKFDPEGRVLMTLGRKPEALTVPAPSANAAAGRGGGGAGVPGDNFNRPTDVAWDSSGNIYVADGYGNSRIAKFDKNGKFVKSWGSRGTQQGQFNLPHTIAIDAQNNIYVGDRENKRIQVFDTEGTFKTQFTNIGAPYAICITPGQRQFLYTSNSNPSTGMDNGEIYKMTLDGKVLGKFGTAGKLLKEFDTVHEMDCRSENELYVGEITNWRVQKLTLKP
jgi:DNA-binding beta-propeller fold protein YncE